MYPPFPQFLMNPKSHLNLTYLTYQQFLMFLKNLMFR
jgi:hypothetical protein